MRNTSLSIILVLVFFGVSFAQIKNEKPELIVTFSPVGEDFLEAISNVEGSFETVFESEGVLAIRICSKDPMPVALSMASGFPFIVTSQLEKRGFSTSNMIYLRQEKNCKLEVDKNALTEFWNVPKGVELPEFIETRKVEDLSSYVLTQAGLRLDKEQFESQFSKGEKLTPELYKSVLNNLIQILKKDRSAIAVIRIPYYFRSSSSEMNKRITFTKKYLLDNGIASHRVYIRMFSIGIKPDSLFKDPKYPDISVVREN